MQIRETRGGLLLAEETAAPREIRDALKKIDPGLILGQEVDSAWSCFVWKVLLRQGDRPAIWLLDWRENLADPTSRPRPLSFSLVDEVWARRDHRRPQLDAERANEEMLAQLEEEEYEETLGLSREVFKRSHTLSPVHRSRGLARSRAKARGEGRI